MYATLSAFGEVILAMSNYYPAAFTPTSRFRSASLATSVREIVGTLEVATKNVGQTHRTAEKTTVCDSDREKNESSERNNEGRGKKCTPC